jgi:AcrR family transcriptional regulator
MTCQSYSVRDARKRLRSEWRHQEVLDAARRIFSRLGYAAASVEEIAKEAGMAKGTIYVHFKSKEEVFATVLVGDLEYLTNQTIRRYVGGKNVRRAPDRFPEPAPAPSSEE